MNGTGDGAGAAAGDGAGAAGTDAPAAPAMPSMIVGGWEYVWGAYGLTLMVVIGYAMLTELWYRRAERINRMEDA